MTKNHMQQILEDLYTIDPELRSHEAELLPLIKTLMAGKRDPKPTKEFADQLRRLLRERAEGMQATTSVFDSLAALFQNKAAFAVVGALVAVVITAPTVYMLTQDGTSLPFAPASDMAEQEETGTLSYKVQQESAGAFGELDVDVSPQANPRPQSGGGGGGMGVSDDARVSSLIYPPGPFYSYTYEYAGDELALPEGDTVDVLRRRQITLSSSAVGMPNLDVIDMGTFRGSVVTQIGLKQDSRNGYMVTLDLNEGAVSIFQNYERWDDPFRKCNGDQSCYDRLQLSMSDIPADSAIIAIADRFLAEHGVDMNNYDAGEVDNNWKIHYENTPEAERGGMVPDTLTVLYPLNLEGKPVYEQYGSRAGISVSVNVRQKAVTGAWNIAIHQYDKSAYPAVQDSAEVLQFLTDMSSSAGDFRITPAVDGGEEIQQEETIVKLGTPTLGIARYYRMNDDNSAMEQILVPAFIFPVADTVNPPSYYSPTPVVVPLAAALLEQAEPVGNPMPLIMEDAAR